MADIQVKIDTFEGPMALLCHLIEKNEINIYDIPISLLAEQYIQSLEELETRDMDNMSEFVLMAATLLEIKSAMLLPKKPKEETTEADPRGELVDRLVEYKRFKEITEVFKGQLAEASKIFYGQADATLAPEIKKRKKPELSELLNDLTLDRLHKIFVETVNRRELKTDKIRSGFNALQKEIFTIKEKSDHIILLLKKHSRISFKGIFADSASKIEIVVTFLALLELVKLKKILVEQNFVDHNDSFSDIMINAVSADI